MKRFLYAALMGLLIGQTALAVDFQSYIGVQDMKMDISGFTHDGTKYSGSLENIESSLSDIESTLSSIDMSTSSIDTNTSS